MTHDQEVLVKAWVAALRSGKYEQGKGYLRFKDRYCCLGVLCSVAGMESEPAGERGVYSFDGHTRMPPTEILEEAGIIEDVDLMEMNDDRDKTFSEIADYIESRPKEIFG